MCSQRVHTMNTLSQTVGWIGTCLIIIAYYLVSSKKVDGGGIRYQALNLIGALCVGVNVFSQKAWPALFLQIVWAIIAIVSLFQNTRKSGKK